MKIAFLQYEISFGERLANQRYVDSLLGNEHFDLLVLPELAFTGYLMQSKPRAIELAEEFDRGPSFDFVHELAEVHDGAVVFGFPERVGDNVYNSAAMVCPDGAAFLYRKTHLFDLEKLWAEPGDTGFNVFEFRDARIGIMICYDWLYPESARTLMLKGADIICHPSNLVLPHCQDAMITRCLENRVFAITSNRTGTEKQGDAELRFTGRSQIIGYKGNVLARADEANQGLRVTVIDPMLARDKRITPHNDLLADRRADLYK